MKDADVPVINAIALEVYEIARDHGFHSDSPLPGSGELVTVDRVSKFCSNLHGEVSELWEAARKGKLDEPCDKEGCDLTCAEEELADLLIRTMDCAVVLGVDLGRAVRRKSQYNAGRPFMHGKKA
jgi:NTP pyrophosphatase (non-canonical NTP hydrolase)